MDFPQSISNNPRLDTIRERHRQAATESAASRRLRQRARRRIRGRHRQAVTNPPASTVVSVFVRLATWLLLAAVMLLVLLDIFATALTSGLAGYPAPESDYRSGLIVATVLYLLSLATLFWPKAPSGLIVFGVVWMVFGGLLLVAFW